MIENLHYRNLCLGIIIRRDYKAEGIEFFTGDENSMQIGYMNRAKGYSILPHVHNKVERTISYTEEVLWVKTGQARIDFFDNDKKYLFSRVVFEGDVILLREGGHGLKMLEDTEIIEIKQGPYTGMQDKVRFESIQDESVQYTIQE